MNCPLERSGGTQKFLCSPWLWQEKEPFQPRRIIASAHAFFDHSSIRFFDERCGSLIVAHSLPLFPMGKLAKIFRELPFWMADIPGTGRKWDIVVFFYPVLFGLRKQRGRGSLASIGVRKYKGAVKWNIDVCSDMLNRDHAICISLCDVTVYWDLITDRIEIYDWNKQVSVIDIFIASLIYDQYL